MPLRFLLVDDILSPVRFFPFESFPSASESLSSEIAISSDFCNSGFPESALLTNLRAAAWSTVNVAKQQKVLVNQALETKMDID
jgi:hypothetical protein